MKIIKENLCTYVYKKNIYLGHQRINTSKQNILEKIFLKSGYYCYFVCDWILGPALEKYTI